MQNKIQRNAFAHRSLKVLGIHGVMYDFHFIQNKRLC